MSFLLGAQWTFLLLVELLVGRIINNYHIHLKLLDSLSLRHGSVFQRRLPKLCLDYIPILLNYGEFQRGSRSFKFENM
jgi:hypothetical protein